MNEAIDLSSLRARQARLGQAIGSFGYITLVTGGSLALVGVGVICLIGRWQDSILLIALALLFYLPAIWWRYQLSVLAPTGDDINGRLSVDVLMRLRPNVELQPQAIWPQLSSHWQAFFFLNHLLISPNDVGGRLASDKASLTQALQLAARLADQNQSKTIELGFVVAGLFLSAPAVQQLLIQSKGQPGDIEALANWLGRYLSNQKKTKNHYGGIGRDWAFGFTPLLDRLGQNLSSEIARHKADFTSLTSSSGVLAIEAAFKNRVSAIALIGPDGIGKTTSIYALAQRLIEGRTNQNLAYHQIISLNATDIVSQARGPGELEKIMISLTNEAARAGHIILFLDDAQLFFGGGPGSFDSTHILLSIIQAGTVPMILAMSSNDYQHLKSQNPSLATLLTPVVLQQMPEAGVMLVLEDKALNLEYHSHVLIAYEALREAYKLSGRYEQDEAYPGKAIKLLEQSLTHAQHNVVNSLSVQQAVEQAYGVKVASAEPAEADSLLHLEDDIHHRMINQSHAVSVVANALRRARAGVGNPNRPVGSFLFLGPTGVGKTELAKAIAASYFKSEKSLIRLDMSEYQQPSDVNRLLSTGQSDTTSMLMSVRQQPFAVILLDEIEKAHPNVLNLLLQMLDEGRLTDNSGRSASFKDCVIIATSNAGADIIRDKIARGESLESFAAEFSDELIKSGQFKPELLNRFDEIVLFRPLTSEELAQVVGLMLVEINKTLAKQNISVELTDAAVASIIAKGNDPRLGARPLRRELQRAVEDTVAQKILKGEARPGDHITLDELNLSD